MDKESIMKKIVMGLSLLGVIILLGTIYFPRQEFNGLEKSEISPQQLLYWQKSSDDLLSEIDDGSFYMQESIGSQGVTLTRPKALNKEAVIRLKMISLSKGVKININIVPQGQSNALSFSFVPDGENTNVEILKEGKLAGGIKSPTIVPDKFYEAEIQLIDNQANLFVDKKPCLSLGNYSLAANAEMEIAIEGIPDNPGALMIKDLQIFE